MRLATTADFPGRFGGNVAQGGQISIGDFLSIVVKLGLLLLLLRQFQIESEAFLHPAVQEATPETIAIAEAAGFVVISMEDVYRGQDVGAIRLAEWDDHPNLSGHQVIAKRLYEDLLSRRNAIFDTVRR